MAVTSFLSLVFRRSLCAQQAFGSDICFVLISRLSPSSGVRDALAAAILILSAAKHERPETVVGTYSAEKRNKHTPYPDVEHETGVAETVKQRYRSFDGPGNPTSCVFETSV